MAPAACSPCASPLFTNAHLADAVQATLEIEFLHQSVNQYVTPQANDTLSKIYDTISQAYRQQKSSDDFHRELDSLKKRLSDSRRATGMETLCFKPRKDPQKASLGVP